MKLTEKAVYIKGLCEGMELDTSKKEGKILAAVLDLLVDMTREMENLEDIVTEIGDELDELTEDVNEIWDDDDDDDDNDEDGCDCPHCQDEYHGQLYEVKCPKCGEEMYLDEDLLMQGGTECPGCGEHLDFDMSEDGESCCGHKHQH